MVNRIHEKVFTHYGAEAGVVNDDTFIMMKRPEDFIFKFSGFGISESVLKHLKKIDVKMIYIYYLGEERNILFECPLDQYLNSELEYPTNHPDTGPNPQKFVRWCDLKKVEDYNKRALVESERIAYVEPLDVEPLENSKDHTNFQKKLSDIDNKKPKVLKRWDDTHSQQL